MKDVHGVHSWSLTTGKPALMAHIIVRGNENCNSVLRDATVLCRRYGIYLTTIQTESIDQTIPENPEYIDCTNNIC